VKLLIHLPALKVNNQLKHFISMHQQKTVIHQILKSFLFVPVVFAFVFTSNAQSQANIPVPISTDSLRKAKPDLDKPDKNGIYQVIEKMPQFPGGEKGLLDYISRNLKYPLDAQEKGIQGRIVVRFVVTKFGKVENVETMRGLYPSIDKEGVRVISSLPDWIPGEQKGEKVSVYYTLPIAFKLEGSTKPRLSDPAKKPSVILDEKLLPNDFDLSTLNKDSVKSVLVAKPDQKEKLEELASKYGANTTNGVIIILTKAYARQHPSPKVEPIDDDKVYDVIDQMPQFRGGEPALLSFISHNLKYPVEAQRKGIQGTVIVRFVVSKTGHVEKVEVLRSLYSALDAESVRVVQSLPDWIPGEQRGEKVNVYYTLPIRFKLQ
jgi:TonB family protein